MKLNKIGLWHFVIGSIILSALILLAAAFTQPVKTPHTKSLPVMTQTKEK